MNPAPTEDPVPSLAVLVVSYNTCALTCAALESLAASTRIPHRVIVVDNASTDGSAEAIRARFPSVELLALSDNIGFARANNLAARLSGERYLLLLNPDTEVLPGAVEALLAFAEARPEARIWGGRTVHSDGQLNPTSCWRRMTLWSVFCRSSGLSAAFPRSNLFNGEAYPGWSRDSVRSVDIVTGCFFLIEKSFWNELDGFDAAFFVYGEEADLCLRARCRGARPAVTPDATIVHHGGASQPDPVDTTLRVLAARIGLLRRHFPAWQRPLALGLVRGGSLLRLAVHRVVARLKSAPEQEPASRRIWRERALWWNGY